MARNLTSPILVETIADLKTFDGAAMFNGSIAMVANATNLGVGRRYRFVSGLASTDTTDQLVVSPTTGAASGRWLIADPTVALRFPWVFNTANNTTLITVPTGIRLHVMRFAAEVTTPMDGGDTASLGVDCTASLNPGGLGSIVALVGNGFQGSQGAEINIPQRNTLVGGNVIRHNILVAGYTAGAGNWHLVCALFQL
jgi:hypothetical protein